MHHLFHAVCDSITFINTSGKQNVGITLLLVRSTKLIIGGTTHNTFVSTRCIILFQAVCNSITNLPCHNKRTFLVTTREHSLSQQENFLVETRELPCHNKRTSLSEQENFLVTTRELSLSKQENFLVGTKELPCHNKRPFLVTTRELPCRNKRTSLSHQENFLVMII